MPRAIVGVVCPENTINNVENVLPRGCPKRRFTLRQVGEGVGICFNVHVEAGSFIRRDVPEECVELTVHVWVRKLAGGIVVGCWVRIGEGVNGVRGGRVALLPQGLDHVDHCILHAAEKLRRFHKTHRHGQVEADEGIKIQWMRDDDEGKAWEVGAAEVDLQEEDRAVRGVCHEDLPKEVFEFHAKLDGLMRG